MAVDYTLQIQSLRKAIGSGIKRVVFDGRLTEFASFDDMLKAIEYLEAEQAVATGVSLGPGYVKTSFSRDDY